MKTASLYLFAFAMHLLILPAVSQTIKSDDFNAFNLKSSVWTFTDPVGDATLTLVGTNTSNARLSIAIPANTSHDPYEGENRVPRIMQAAPDSDFVIQAKFDSPVSSSIQIQGILVEASPSEFLRFDFYSNAGQTWLYSALGGPFAGNTNIAIAAADTTPLYMRVARTGNAWTQSYSFDGIAWIDAPAYTYAMAVTKVGVYAANASGSASPAHTVLVDYFQNNASPIISEDGNSSVVDSLKPLTYNITTSSAPTSLQINWKTDEAANGKVQYGLTNSYELGFISHSNFVTSHSLPIPGLATDTTYHYRIISADNGGRADTTTDRTAATGSPFSISNVQVFKTSRSATVTWLTGTNTTSKVIYGTTISYTDSASDTTKVASHFLNFSGLMPSTLYHFKVTSADSANNIVSTLDSTFTTNAATTLATDEFNSATLDTAKWLFLNPLSDGTQSMTGTQLSLAVPGGIRHDMWDDNKDALRVRQNCTNADFEITVKFDLGVSQGFQLQGLIAQQDSANFVRFDFNSDGVATNMFAATFVANASTIQLNQLPVDTNNVHPIYMRITRQGALWKQEYSLNGTTWTVGVTFYHLLSVSSVALFAGNSGGNPAMTSRVDYFRLTPPPTVTANLKTLLQGAYSASGDTMSTNIRSSIPFSQPYSASPWNYAGVEAVSNIPANVVDWILIELRSGTAANTMVARRAAFLTKSGTIVDTSGIGAVTFVNVDSANYYVIVHHRNHLSIMTANSIALNQSSSLYDFTTASAQAFGVQPQMLLDTNVWGMYSGDVNGSRVITVADANQVLGSLNQTIYSGNDANFSGIVSTADANIIFENLNKTSQVP